MELHLPITSGVMQTPSVGRIVHYTPPASVGLGPGPIAAMITEIPDISPTPEVPLGEYPADYPVALALFVPGQIPGYLSGLTPYSEFPVAGHWSWPPRG